MNHEVLLDGVCEMGYQLLGCGGQIYRVEDTMRRLVAAYGLSCEVFAIPNCLIVSVADEHNHVVTRMRQAKVGSIDILALERFNALSRRLCANPPEDPAEIARQVKEVAAVSRPFPIWIQLLGFFIGASFFSMFFSGGLLASYMVNTQIYGLKNTYLALILPGACSTFYVVIMRTFFQTTIPDSIIESGKIDGASQLRIFVQLVLPLALPVIATIGLFFTFNYWNAWYGAMLYLDSNHRELYPLQYVLISIENNISFMARNEEYFSEETIAKLPTETMRMAIVMVVVIPIACSYPFFQRYFVGGLTIGAVKG